MTKTLGNIILYSLEELSKALEIPVTTFRGYIKQGRLNACRLGSSFYVTEASLLDFLQPDKSLNLIGGQSSSQKSRFYKQKERIEQ